eukprot:scaffold381696_cov48-Prasinocladus_malaysianus.AAC.1
MAHTKEVESSVVWPSDSIPELASHYGRENVQPTESPLGPSCQGCSGRYIHHSLPHNHERRGARVWDLV